MKAFIFDLDGTLVQTETLKAKSYAKAAMALRPNEIDEKDIFEAFKDVVGLTRQEVATKFVQRFALEEALKDKMFEWEVTTPWQAFLQMRIHNYESLLSDPHILNDYLCPYNIGLLKWAKRKGYKTGLATMSHKAEVQRVLHILNLNNDFNFIATRDDVENGKPDPEIYLLVAQQLGVINEQCIVIEDSLTGFKAAKNAGMECIVVTNDFTRKAIHNSELIEKKRIVDDPRGIKRVVQHLLFLNSAEGSKYHDI
jgi:beta-phosphoglucomutase